MSQLKRRNASPSSLKQGPLKAVIAFSLKNTSSSAYSTRSSNSSPTTRTEKLRGTRKSPDHRSSPERRSPSSPNQREKSRLYQSPIQNLSVSSAWQANSADPVVPYLTGQWPKDISSYHHYQSGGTLTCDKSTQTVDVWEKNTEKKKSGGHRRSASFDHGDLSKEVIKQRLQKTKEGSRQEWGRQRSSPVTGVHSALSMTAPPSIFVQSKPIIIPPTTNIPAKPNVNRFQRNSVEGLNKEIEKLVLFKPGSVSVDGQEPVEADSVRVHSIPDGHHAPIPEVTQRSVDTQTPSAQEEELQLAVSASIAHSDSVSPGTAGSLAPSHVAELLHPESRSNSIESKSSKGDSEYNSPEPSAFESSPKPEKSCPFVREPPDGCEKVKVIEETRKPSIKEPLLFCPVKPNQFVFKQSQGSAFCPLIKQYLEETGDLQALRPSVTLSGPCVSVLAHTSAMEGQ